MSKQLLKQTKIRPNIQIVDIFLATWPQSWGQSCDKWMMLPPPPLWCGMWWFCAASAVHSTHMVPNQTNFTPNESEFNKINNKNDKTYKQFTTLVTWAKVGTNGRDHMIMGLQPDECRARGWGPYHGGGQERRAADHILRSLD